MIEPTASIVSNFWYALLALLIATAILHFFLVYLWPISKRGWKKTDYLWLLLTLAGLLSAINKVNASLNRNQAQSVAVQIPGQYRFLLFLVTTRNPDAVCRTFTRSEYSPDNFDELVVEYDSLCAWKQRLYRVVRAVDTVRYSAIDTSRLPITRAKADPEFIRDVQSGIRVYNRMVEDKGRLDALADEASSDGALTYLSPMLFILGFALRVTKVTGELMLEK